SASPCRKNSSWPPTTQRCSFGRLCPQPELFPRHLHRPFRDHGRADGDVEADLPAVDGEVAFGELAGEGGNPGHVARDFQGRSDHRGPPTPAEYDRRHREAWGEG